MTRDTKTSWVETTLPPGYFGYKAIREHGPSYGFCKSRNWYGDEAERNRAAWRHWTAAVLRGQDVEWEDNGEDGTNAWVGNVRLERYQAIQGVCNCVSVYVYDDVRGAHEKVRDDDEAMARFAFLVSGIHGPAMKGGK